LKIIKSLLLIQNNNPVLKNKAFTLIELIVVMALMSILLFFSIPRLDINIFSDDTRDFSTWMLMTVKSLKETSQRENQLYSLCVDLDNDQMWKTQGLQSEQSDQTEAAKQDEYKLPEGLRLIDVEFPEMEKKASGIVEIRFYPQGYSDKALIHIEDNDNKRSSYLVEPFLSQVKIYDHYFEF